jgi:hypothetical protein
MGRAVGKATLEETETAMAVGDSRAIAPEGRQAKLEPLRSKIIWR